jgi:hypothetical protein
MWIMWIKGGNCTRGVVVRLLFVVTVGATAAASTWNASLTTEIAAIFPKAVM